LGTGLPGMPKPMDRKMIGIYLNDHLAGSVVGSSLARRFERQNRGNDYGRPIGEIAREIEEDQAALIEVMDRVGVRRKQMRLAIARVAEFGMRLKPNGKLIGYSPLSRVIELEGLTVGITGKLELWRSLGALENGSRVAGVYFERLAARAEDQRDRVADLRVRAAREALGGSTGRA
jgi:hypothetical protein